VMLGRMLLFLRIISAYPIQPVPNDFLPGVSARTFGYFYGTISRN
jgi:hypothetical protein